MVSRVTKIRIAEHERRLHKLTGSLQTALTEARLVRRTLEMVDEMRRTFTSQLTRPHRPRQRLDLRHANRMF
jgi:hypothetical protein